MLKTVVLFTIFVKIVMFFFWILWRIESPKEQRVFEKQNKLSFNFFNIIMFLLSLLNNAMHLSWAQVLVFFSLGLVFFMEKSCVEIL